MFPTKDEPEILLPPGMWPCPAFQPVQLLHQTRAAQLYLAVPKVHDLTSEEIPTVHATLSPEQVVVKLLAPHLSEEHEARVLFRDEIRLLQHLHHPCIVHCWEAQEEGPLPYVVMEYIQGCDLGVLLQHQLDTHCPLPWTQSYRIASGILQGLVYLHNTTDEQDRNLGVVYRDLAPANVLLGVQGEVKLIDFGLATHKRMVRFTVGDSLRGTFAYLAPELLEDAAATRLSDIFAWGVLAWETFTGQRLFDAPHPDAILRQLREKPILPVHQVNADVPYKLSEWIQRALERDRTLRPSTSEALKEAWTALAPTSSQIKEAEHGKLTLEEQILQCQGEEERA